MTVFYDVLSEINHCRHTAAHQGREPELALYIDLPTWDRMKAELHSEHSHFATEYLDHGTFAGVPLWKVAADDHGWRVVNVKAA